jgi:hypothetical protein
VNRSAGGGPEWPADCGAARADGGSSGPPGPPCEEGASNHSPVPWLKTVVLNGVRKGVTLIMSGVGREDERWAGNGPLPSEASKSPIDDIKTGVSFLSRDESGGYPFTAQVVSGV